MNDHPRFEFIGTPSERARSGAKMGAIMASAFSLYVISLYLMRGNAPFETLDTSLWASVLRYYVAGFVAGPIIGIVWPLRVTRVGNGAVAGLGAFLVYTVAWMTQEGSPLKWSLEDWAGPLGLGVLFFLGGMIFFRPPPPPPPLPDPVWLRTTLPEEKDPDEV
jgi:hypothetical protein